MVQPAAWTFLVLTIGLAVFQVALAAGAPLGRFAWGGQHERPPTGLRIGSAVSILIYGACALIILERAGLVQVLPDPGSARIGAWVVVALFAPGVLMNAISRSPPERYTMTPLALALLISALIVALG